MEKRLLHRDLAQEKVKQLQKELEEIRNSLSSTEDLCNILRKKRQRLEKEYAELDERHKGTKIEVRIRYRKKDILMYRLKLLFPFPSTKDSFPSWRKFTGK